jgi:hypothetical protein
LTALTAVESLAAQVVTGAVRDAESGDPIVAAIVSLLGRNDGALVKVATNEAGEFRIVPPGPGQYRLRAQRIGYATTTTDILQVAASDLARLELSLSTEPVPLAPLIVDIASRPWWEYERPDEVWGFYERMEYFGQTGFARFLTIEDLEFQRRSPAWMILSNQIGFGIRAEFEAHRGAQRSIRIRGPLSGSNPMNWCSPVYFIDGLPFRAEEWVALHTIEVMADEGRIEGIETYSPWHVPWTFQRHFTSGDGGCAIAVWTKQQG